MKIRNKLLAAATIVALSGPAHADYFGELGFGIGESDFGTLDFTNPVGTAFTGSRVQGNNILLSNLDDSDDSSGGYVRAGYNLNDKTSLYISYRDFGEMATSGTALFSGVNFLHTFSRHSLSFLYFVFICIVFRRSDKFVHGRSKHRCARILSI